jgi:DMSO/TMAO reductase YedYZ molybdopterin-dependent catalytic subunit
MKNRGVVTGMMVGLVVSAPLLAVLYLAERAGGLPFVPFDVFDGMARLLPGDVITLGIDAIVALISGLNLGETSSAAKLIEQVMALGMFLLVGVIAGGAYFAVQRRRHSSDGIISGLVLGFVVSIPMLLMFDAYNQTSTVPQIFGALWLLLAFLVWGAAIGWIYQQLTESRVQEEAAAESVAAAEVPAEPVQTTVMNRRQFMIRVGNAAALITVAGAGLGSLLESGGAQRSTITVSDPNMPNLPPNLPNAGAAVVPAPGTRPEYTPLDDHYRIDINLVPPTVDLENWVLPIEGLVDNPMTFTLEQLQANYESMDQFVTMACISNRIGGDLIGTTMWTGVSLQAILADLQPQDDAAYLKITGADGFHETVALDLIAQDERIMLAYAWDNQPLRQKHGAPLRIYIPDRYGMKQPKWITEIEVVADYEEGYWVRRGWDEVAQMRTTSVIDTVASEALIDRDGQLLVPVGGIAHAGARGISKVEVKVDEGEWQEAQLREPLSDTTWVVWRYDWPFEEGRHTFAVRAYDGNDIVQDSTVRGARPSGATGIHSYAETLALPAEEEAPTAG